MATRFRDRYLTTLEFVAAEKLAREMEDLLEPPRPTADVEPSVPGSSDLDDGFYVTSVAEMRGEDEERLFDGDVSIDVERDTSSLEEIRARATSLDETTRHRLGTMRSTIVVEFVSGAAEVPLFVSVQRMLLDRIGPGVVELQGKRIVTTEVFAKELEGLRGSSRLEGARRPSRRPRKKRQARPGELESVGLRMSLADGIEDPFRSGKLRRALEAAPPVVRSYAALLLDEGPMSDQHAAKSLGVKHPHVAEARAALSAILGA